MSAHIVLTSHTPGRGDKAAHPIRWGAATAQERGPVVASVSAGQHRNAIGTHSGAYAIYRALAVAAGELNARPSARLHQHLAGRADRPVSAVGRSRARSSRSIRGATWWPRCSPTRSRPGCDIRPTIAVTKAHINMPEMHGRHRRRPAQARRRRSCARTATSRVTKAAIEPVWYLPGVAERFGVSESDLRRSAVRADRRHVPRAGHAARPRGVPAADRRHDDLLLRRRRGSSASPRRKIACRVHDECNGSDVFGSDICTCRPYLAHGIEVCIEMAQQGGVGLVVYNRKEGRALGEVTKFLVYNARKRQVGGDRADDVFRPHRMRGRRAGHALPGADARRVPLARHHAHRPLGLDEQHEVRRARRAGHRGRSSGCRSPTS